jgi:hypothetical protein
LDKKKLHINEAGSKNYPEPDIPVENAWDSMKQLLQHAPAAPASHSVLAKGKLFSKLIAATGSVVIMSSIIYMIATNKQKPATTRVIPAKAATPQTDTLANGSTAYLDYTNKVFEFSNMPFRDAAAYIEKAYGVKFIINNHKLFNCTITTRLVLGYTLAFEYEIDKTKNQVTISGDGCN